MSNGINCAIMVCNDRCSRRIKKKVAYEHAFVQSCSAERKYVASHTRNTPTATLRCSWRSDVPFVVAVARCTEKWSGVSKVRVRYGEVEEANVVVVVVGVVIMELSNEATLAAA